METDHPVLEAPITEEMVYPWLARIRPQAALALFREPGYSLIAAYAFSGFRINTQGYANPLVRRRLALAATKDEEFAERLRVLAEASAPTDGHAPERLAAVAPVIAQPESDGQGAQQKKGIAELRSERDRRRRERDEARAELEDMQKLLHAAVSAREAAEEEARSLEKSGERQAQRIDRYERQVARLRTEQTALLRALSRTRTRTPVAVAPEPAPAAAPIETGQASPWEDAVRRLLDKGRDELAMTMAEDVLRADPDDIAAREIAAIAAERREEIRTATEHREHGMGVLLTRGENIRAIDFLFHLLMMGALDHNAARLTRQLLAGVQASGAETILALRAMLARLRSLRPVSHAWMVEQITRVDEHTLLQELIPPPGAIEPDEPLPLSSLPVAPVTARGLISAIDSCDEAVVVDARAALARLSESDPETFERVTAAVERASRNDLSYLVTLLDPLRGPIVVDGSNVAWHDQPAGPAARPRLRQLMDVRRALRSRGYFPIIIYADAPLPYTIDEPERLREMAAHGEVNLVATGVDADEALVREAGRLDAPLVTNDYMMDWDPNNEVVKLRYMVSSTGDTYLLPPYTDE
jgi:hypothetical protein